jgi:pSer/pThr/pTyr-binding forkhead associated (FHA) protein
MLHAALRVLSGRQNGALIPLPVGKFLIGREEDCQLRPNSELVSRHHCVFTNDDFTVRLRDLGSTNGTFVNGERLRGGVMLKSGDKVSVGKIDFEVLVGDEAQSAERSAVGAPSASPPGVDDTRTVAISETSTEIPAVSMPVEPPVAVQTGDTVYQGVPGQMPGYMPPPGYPPQYMQQPYPYPSYPPGYPGYYPMPMGYPGQPMYPQQPVAAPAATAPAASETGGFPEVKLPDPATTGAKPPEAPPAKPADDAKGANAANVPETAEKIIKQYLQRRPTSQ